MQGATIKIFLVNGNPEGLRTAEISNWTGKAIAAPRTELKEFISRNELNSPGIYILVGVDSISGESVLYIGETESVSTRISEHTKKDFWNTAIAFVSKDENLTKAHIKYLESKLIEKAKTVNRCVLDNSATSNSKLPESDISDMEVFLTNIYQLLPILGVNQFRTREERTQEEPQLLYCKIKDLVATGKQSATGFVVFKGSQAVLLDRPSAHPTIKFRRSVLLTSGTLIQKGNHLVFNEDVEFSSPSTAGSIIRGVNTNGLTTWKTAEGKTLKQLENEWIKEAVEVTSKMTLDMDSVHELPGLGNS